MTKIYLLSPPKIEVKKFSDQLKSALSTGLIPTFQLRLKGYEKKEIISIAKELKKICHDSNCLFLLNDCYETALDIDCDGVHLGAEDGSIAIARKAAGRKNFLIGASCYDSRHLAMEAGEQGADYLSFGTFFNSKTKNSRGKPTMEILTWCNEFINLPTVAIGGVTDENCAPLVKAGVDFLAVISFVWDNPQGAKMALEKLNSEISYAS